MTQPSGQAPHPLQRRLLAEDLLRRRLADDGRRFAASQRRGRIDPNPHQIDAVVFALRRIPFGGCILADEVGLGKTIEAGLVIAQLLAEGKRRILLIVPKSLLGQWKAELYDLFGIDARETTAHPDEFRGDGVFLVHRELAGGVTGGPLLWASDPFDLVVIDEAHEIFASIYKRYSKDGSYDETAREAQTAHRVRELLRKHRVPVLLLTATPIQNNLTELWGLVQYVEPTPALLGKIPTFREIFCEENDRHVSKTNADELRRRLSKVVQRTLRRQAQEFLEVPFVPRQTRLVEYTMGQEERALYDAVSAWLLRPELAAFSGNNGKLLLIGFLRRMASSLPALAASLRKVADRMRATLDRIAPSANVSEHRDRDFSEDLEEDIDEAPPMLDAALERTSRREKLRLELTEVEDFIRSAEAIKVESKARALLEKIKEVQEQGKSGEGTGKVVIFTESLTTQDAIRDLLIQNGVPDQAITLFRGKNDSPRAHEALRVWESEVKLPPEQRLSTDVAMRLALVHEFKEHSSVFISTEAGAKGLNLQFCETLVNYDLPWNPQRIEQRIGRVHRYGQKRKVNIINFVARDNEAQRLTFEILSQKLELFGTVLNASDVVLHNAEGLSDPLVSALGYDLESELRRINLEAHSQEEIAARLRILRDQLSEKRQQFDEEQSRTSRLIESRLDDAVRGVFKNYKDRLGVALGQLDQDLDKLLCGYLDSLGIPYERQATDQEVRLQVSPSDRLPANYKNGGRCRTGNPRDNLEVETLHLSHPLVRAAVEEARTATADLVPVRWVPPENGWPEFLVPFLGKRGRIAIVKVAYDGLEPVDHIIATAVVENVGAALPNSAVAYLLSLSPLPGDGTLAEIEPQRIADAIDTEVFSDQAAVEQREEAEFAHRLSQLDRFLDDQIIVLERKKAAVIERQEKLDRQYSADVTAVGRDSKIREIKGVRSEIASIQERIDALEAREDDDYRKWLDQLYARRYVAPRVEKLLDVDFLLDRGTTC